MQEKQEALLAEQQDQQRLDLLMEIERLKALEAYQVRVCMYVCSTSAMH